jgi:hypothetical protein
MPNAHEARVGKAPLLHNRTWWQALPQFPPTDCPGWLATHVSGELYALLALCLRRQLLQYHTACPMLVVVDDVKEDQRLRDTTLAALRREFEVVNLSSLVSRAYSDPAISWAPQEDSVAAAHASATNLSSRDAAAAQRPVRSHHFVSAANKYFLWALDPVRYPLVAYLDVDVLLLRNIDALLHLRFEQPIAAVTSAPLCNMHGSFNSGVLVLKPNLETLAWLLLGERFAGWPWKGRVPRFNEARLARSPHRPVAIVRKATATTSSVQQQQQQQQQQQLTLSWVEACAPAGCTKDNLRSCLAGAEPLPGTSRNVYFGGLPVANSSSSNSSVGGPSLEACKKRLGGTYSWSRRLRKTCEPSPRDQSVLNWLFNNRTRWRALPRCYNVQPSLWAIADRGGLLGPGGPAEACIVHFAGSDKPWRRTSGGRTRAAAAEGQIPQKLLQLWRGACPDLSGNTSRSRAS